jgi:dTMP kinase
MNQVCHLLEQRGYAVVQTREPGGTVIADKIRGLLLDPIHREMTPQTEALLYMAARAQHTTELIMPALARGAVVISDRYADSSLVYQGVARGLAQNELVWLNRFATKGLTPDLTILLDGAVDRLAVRVAGRGNQDRLDSEGCVFHQKVRAGFLELARCEPDRIRIIDADRDIELVWADIEACVLDFLMKRGRSDAVADQQ